MKTIENNIYDIASDFAIRIVNLYKYLTDEKHEYVMSKQILRSGTSIGANIRESEFGESSDDFKHKLKIALKEANETEYWIEILHKSEYINDEQYDSIIVDCKEIIKLLIASINTLNKNNY